MPLLTEPAKRFFVRIHCLLRTSSYQRFRAVKVVTVFTQMKSRSMFRPVHAGSSGGFCNSFFTDLPSLQKRKSSVTGQATAKAFFSLTSRANSTRSQLREGLPHLLKKILAYSGTHTDYRDSPFLRLLPQLPFRSSESPLD